MILVGQYDSPYVRRVAVSLRVLEFEYEHDTRSVFADFDAMRATNPLGRIPSLVLDDAEVLIDSAAILDWLDQTVGPERALLPAAGAERRRALRLIALATGAMHKVGAAAYERLIRPAALRWPEWTLRCRTQGAGAIAALAAEPGRPATPSTRPRSPPPACSATSPWPTPSSCSPAAIPPSKRCPAVRTLRGAARIQATWPAEYAVPRNP
jgi:glutathione S-transferase